MYTGVLDDSIPSLYQLDQFSEFGPDEMSDQSIFHQFSNFQKIDAMKLREHMEISLAGGRRDEYPIGYPVGTCARQGIPVG